METLNTRQKALLLAKLQEQHQCLVCKQFGCIADNGVKCHFCKVFFHLSCIDPLRTTPLASSYAENPTPTIWTCEDCASEIEQSDSDNSEDSSYMDSSVSSSDEEPARLADDVLNSLGTHPHDCMCGDCSTETDSETRAEEEEILHGEAVRETEQMIAKVQRGEKIWTKSECSCEVCSEANEAADPEVWNRIVARAKNDRQGHPVLRATVTAMEAAQGVVDRVLEQVSFGAGRAAEDMDTIHKRGHY